MAKATMPRKNRAPKGPLKKKSELERLQEAAGAAAAAAEAAEAAAAGGEVEPMKEAARAAARESAALPKTMSLQLPTRPVEEASEGRDDEAPVPAPDGKPALASRGPNPRRWANHERAGPLPSAHPAAHRAKGRPLSAPGRSQGLTPHAGTEQLHNEVTS